MALRSGVFDSIGGWHDEQELLRGFFAIDGWMLLSFDELLHSFQSDSRI